MMTTMWKIALLVLMLPSCVQPNKMYISDSCTPSEINKIYDTVEYVNSTVGSDFNIAGINSVFVSDPNDDFDMVICRDIADSPDGRLGNASWGGDITIFIDGDDPLFSPVLMHELGHNIRGDDRHLGDGNIMSAHLGAHKYTIDDILFLKVCFSGGNNEQVETGRH